MTPPQKFSNIWNRGLDVARICVIVLNYNGWADTLECLESLLRSTFADFQVVVVDNASTDDSITRLKAWANGELSLFVPPGNPLRHLSQPPIPKPIPFNLLRQDELDSTLPECEPDHPIRERLVFITANRNRGYAAGNNLGLKWAQANGPFTHFWILNNDTVIPSESPARLMEFARRKKTDLTGVKLLNYTSPHSIQSLGGRINRFFGTSLPILSENDLPEKLDYIEGAALLLSRKCLERNGMLPEEYFLFFEEVDYCFTARRKKLKLDIALSAEIFHKGEIHTPFPFSNPNPQKNEFRDFTALESRVI
ncbi:MAG: glycosyltransferase, partial [Deltaproteobacteria bacterium]|nr:glycosyltransferase [Deltaproteobacteria bacterium]